MDKSTFLRFQGYSKTHSLFNSNSFTEFNLLQFNSAPKILKDPIEFRNHRLGKLVEEFVFYQLHQQDNVEWIAENIQIQRGKQTIGEMDALFYLNNQPIHLEVVYKFYLYDTLNTYQDPLAYWIGPNRKDSLLYKLDKLKNKQFPLLYKEETQQHLKTFDIDISKVEQQVCFKAQLFLPYNQSKTDVALVNKKCVRGFFISYEDISIFEEAKFYVPNKLDWLIIPHNHVEWLTFVEVKEKIEKQIKDMRSPLIWIKHNDDVPIEKCFITFW